MNPSADDLFQEEASPAAPKAPALPKLKTTLLKPRLVLKPFQEKAVAEAVRRYTYSGGERSQLIYGGTGSGKTLALIEILLDTMRKDLKTNPTPEIVVIVTPSVGGNLGPQWRNELARQGVDPSQVINLGSSFFRDKTDKWWASLRQNPPFTRCDKPLFVITTFHTLHNSVKKYGDSSIYMTLKFTHMVVDEAQFYRNGSHREKKHEEIDPTKVMFGSIVKVQRNASCRVLVASATPFYNSRVDVYSLVVLMQINGGRKTAWHKKATQEQWSQQKRWFWDNHVIAIAVPPEYSKNDCVVRHPSVISHLSARESQLAMDAYCALAALVGMVLQALSKLPSNNPAVYLEIDKAMRIMLGQLTRCRRGLQHPAFYDEPVRKVDANGKETVLPVPLSRLDDFGVEHCSKFNSLIETLKSESGRMLVTCHFSRPLDFLEVYLKRHLPSWAVVLHHGKTDCVNALHQFDVLGETQNVVMLATAGSIGEGINLSLTTEGGTKAVGLICLDFPLSSSAQLQLEGRIKRPLAQPDVEAWQIHRIESQANFPKPPHLLSVDEWDGRRGTVDQALKQVLALKENAAEEMLASEEEIANLAERGRKSNYGSEARKSMRSLLHALLSMCNSWLELQSPDEILEAKVRRERKRETRAREISKRQKVSE